METLNVLENYQKIDDETKSNFIDAIDSEVKVKINYEKKEIDYTWVDMIYENMIYIDNILRNPKKFIVNEEEIVKIELAKKITVESIIHLTQHTNLIQDYNPNTNDVTPSKILNINKEESLDTYENRFIYTLIKQIDDFINRHEIDLKNSSYLFDEKQVNYNANAKIDNEDVKISLVLNSDNKAKGETNVGDIREKLKIIKVQLAGFMGTGMVSTLSKLHVSVVRPPIRKTNVILKNPNFQRAEQLWNFFQHYDNNNFTLKKDNKEYIETGNLKQQFDESFLLNYLAMTTLSKDSKKTNYEKTMTLTIGKIIEMLVDSENFNKRDLDDLIAQEYHTANNKIKTRDKIILETISDKFSKIDEMILEACLILK